jgi:D-amino peptidase
VELPSSIRVLGGAELISVERPFSSRALKVYISVDMEGVSGIVDWSQVDPRKPQEYEAYRKLMVADLNAAIEGVLEAGAEEVVVADSHGRMNNLPPEEVHEAAILIRGSPRPWLMMEGIDESFDAALYVGYHSMKGTERGVLCHTISGRVVDAVYINEIEMGEFGLNTALASWHGVPSIFISGDAAAVEEAWRLVPNIQGVIVKWGVSRYAARCLNPKRARRLIREKASEALRRVREIKLFRVEEPVEVRMRFVTSTMADVASILPFAERADGRTIRMIFEDYPTAFKALRAAIAIAYPVEER